jgi:hypothetical protein
MFMPIHMHACEINEKRDRSWIFLEIKSCLMLHPEIILQNNISAMHWQNYKGSAAGIQLFNAGDWGVILERIFDKKNFHGNFKLSSTETFKYNYI